MTQFGEVKPPSCEQKMQLYIYMYIYMFLLELMVHMVHTPVWLIIAAIKLAWLGSMGIEHFYLGGNVWAFGRPFFVGWCWLMLSQYIVHKFILIFTRSMMLKWLDMIDFWHTYLRMNPQYRMGCWMLLVLFSQRFFSESRFRLICRQFLSPLQATPMMLSKLYVSIFDQEAWMVRRDCRPGFRTCFESIYNLVNVYNYGTSPCY